MRAIFRAGVVATALMLLISTGGYPGQSSTAGLPLTLEDVIWDPRTDEGKRLKERLQPELEVLAVTLKDSGFTLEENDIAVVVFEESGKKVGLELGLMSAAIPTGSEGSTLPSAVSDRVAQAVAPIVRHPGLLEDEELDCFVFEFRWPGSESSFAYNQGTRIIGTNPGTGQQFSFPSGPVSPGTGSIVWSSVSVEIPRVILQAIADSTISASEMARYVKEAGARRRM